MPYGFASTPPAYPYSVRRLSADSVATTRESQYDMCSVPDASMVHTELLQQRAPTTDLQAENPPTRDPFSDSPEDDPRSPLFIQTNVPRDPVGNARTSNASPVSSRSQSRWGALSPTSSLSGTLSRVRSRLGTLASSHSSQSHSHSPSESRTSPLSPMLFADPSQISRSDDPFADSDWSHMDDPFANLNARSIDLDQQSRKDYGVESPKSTYAALLQKIRRK